MSVEASALGGRPDIVDQFGRTVASGWGTAPTGQTWAVSSTSLTSVGSGRGVMDPSAANQGISAALVAPAADIDIQATCYLPETPSGNTIGAYLIAKADGSNLVSTSNRYEVLAVFNTDGTVLTRLRSVVSGATTNLITLQNNVAYTPGTGLNLRLRIVGSTLSAKAWFVGDAEPAWLSVVNTSLTAAGYCGVGQFRLSGNTSTDDRLLWDNFSCRALYPNVVDSFSRTVAAGSWGASDSGHGYTLSGTASDFSVSGGLGRIAPSVTNSGRNARITLPHMDVDAVIDVGAAQVATGDPVQANLNLREDASADTMYRVEAQFNTAGNAIFSLRKRVAGSQTNLASSFVTLSYTAGEMFRIRFQCVGATIRAKAWRAADPEPASWSTEQTDSAITSGARLGVLGFRNASNTSTDPTVLFDNFFVRPLRPAINDAFDRTVASGWGNLTSGQAWINSDSSKMSVGSGHGVLAPDANTAAIAAIPAPSADYEVRATVDIAQTQTGAPTRGSIYARASSTANGADRYYIQATFNTSGQVDVILAKSVSGGTTLATLIPGGTSYTPGTGLHVRLRCVGSRIMGKAWFANATEPAWSEVQDTALVAAGLIQCNSFRNSGNTSTDPSVFFDDFQVIDLSRPLRLDTGVTSIDPARLVTI
jgi:hypothetical protein